jgi:hypothetical protein
MSAYDDYKNTVSFVRSYITERHTYEPEQKKRADLRFSLLATSIVLVGITYVV